MAEREFRLLFERCPSCGSPSDCQLVGKIHSIPYFGETIESLIVCGSCGFRHADVTHTESKEPRRYEYLIESPEDLKTRVVRSSTGVIEIPELGVSITPGPKSDGFVSNVEGVLERVREAIEIAAGEASPTGRMEAEKKLKLLEEMKSGRSRGWLILWDPRGQSAILHPKARSRKLSPEELSET